MKPIVYAFPGNESLARRLCGALDAEPGEWVIRRFPDSETYVRFVTLPHGRDAMFACSLQQPDEKMAGLAFAAATARESGARRIGLVAPYLAYLRQDTAFKPGEAVASRIFARWLSGTVDWLATVHPHLHRRAALGEIYGIPTAAASASAAIADWIGAHVDDPLIVGPDAESSSWVADVAARVNAPSIVLSKERSGDRDVCMSLPASQIARHRTPVIIDDILSTARTMSAAVDRLVDAGSAPPICIGVHALFCGDAFETLQRSGARSIITCNTIEHSTNAIDVFPALAAAVRSLSKERSP
ncbi:MAG TPA: ribose-phosphate diphosphokinase [Rudaea sp.]